MGWCSSDRFRHAPEFIKRKRPSAEPKPSAGSALPFFERTPGERAGIFVEGADE